MGDLHQAMQRRQVQRAEPTLVAHVQLHFLVEQALDTGQKHVFAARGAGFGTRTQQQQQRGDAVAGDAVRVSACQQHRIQQGHQAGAIPRGEAVQRRAMQRAQALRIGGLQVGTGLQQARDQIRQAQRRRQHQHGDIARQALFQPGICLQQAVNDLRLAHAHRRRQRGGAGVGGMAGVRTARQQQLDQAQMAATGGTQQCGAALAIHRIHRQAQVQQAAHAVEVAHHRGGRHVVCTQRPPGQRPAAPVQPCGQVTPAGGQRHAQRGLPIGGATVRRGTCRHQRFDRVFLTQRGRQMQRAHAAAVACIQVHTGRDQLLQHARPLQAHRQRDRRIACRRHAEWIRAAFQQLEGEGFIACTTRRGQAGRHVPRQATATGG